MSVAKGSQTFPYQASTWYLAKQTAVNGLLAIFSLYMTVTNDRGLVINGLIEFGRNGATLFYLGLTVSFVVMLMRVAGLALQRAGGTLLVVSESGIRVPGRWWSFEEQDIPFQTVKGAKLVSYGQDRWLEIKHSGGKTNIEAVRLPSPETFRAAAGLITQRLKAVGISTG